MKFNNFERKIFKDLFKASKGLHLFTFHARYRISTLQLGKFLDKYQKNDIILLHGDKLYLTQSGRKFLLGSNLHIIKENNSQHSLKVPEKFLDVKLEINTFYVPDITKLDIHFFDNFSEALD